MNQSEGCSSEFKNRLEYLEFSPCKDKDVSSLVPGINKWSTEDHSNDIHSEFRPRLHSSPYVDENFVGRLRTINKEKQRFQPVPFLSIDDESSHILTTPHLSHYTSKEHAEQFTDSGVDSVVGLQQTRFYDNLSSRGYPADSGVVSSVGLGSLGSLYHSNDTGEFEAIEKRAEEEKYAFDPLAPPFKPRSTVTTTHDLQFDKSNVMAIDVANYVSSKYNKKPVLEEARLPFSDITNHISDLPELKMTSRIPKAGLSHEPNSNTLIPPSSNCYWSTTNETTSKIVLSTSVSTNVAASSREKMPVLSDIVTSDSVLRQPAIAKLEEPNPITNGIKNSPLAKTWISPRFGDATNSKVMTAKSISPTPSFQNRKENIQTENMSTISNPFDLGLGLATGSNISVWKDYDLLNPHENLKTSASHNDDGNLDSKWRVNQNLFRMNSLSSQRYTDLQNPQKKVTFADIVQAGIRAINRQKAENPDFYAPTYEPSSSSAMEPPTILHVTTFDPNHERNDIFVDTGKLKNDEQETHKPSKYRTEPCTTFHTIGVCPYGTRCNFYHTDAERNELPTLSSAMRYKTRLCKTWQKAGECPYGNKCDFAHGTDDLASNCPYKPHYKTRMCKVLQQTGRCPYGAQCTFAHEHSELRTDISMIYKYKTEICKSWSRGLECAHGTDCHFAHGEKELKNESDLFGR
uniref:uncharacterized protein LOC120348306 n=1 Tax=Styela clava TaxID=7725 RepID=UPI00193AC7A8|nr:uncharacterized protein LOC120348306 [Styela clava]